MKNFKKVISAVIALAMFASSIATVGASKYTDVADTAAYAEAVEVLTALGIVTGYEENGTYTFKPEGTITRAEAATMIVGALNMTEDAKASAGTSPFADVNANAAWAAGYINVGVAQGFIKGMDATTFAPQDNVTYAQMCVMLTTIAGYGEYAAANSTGTWSSGYTNMAASTGINKGVAVADNTALTRGQVAQMIYNTLVTPMLGVAEYSLTGNTYSQLDGKNNREYKTLLSDKFDGYVATVLVTATPLSAGLENDEVNFTVTKADWWPEVEEPITSNTAYATESLFAEGVDVNGNHLQSGKAVYVTNADDELVMVYFAPNGKTVTKEIAATDYVLQAKLGASNKYTTTNNKIRFGGTSYKMADTIDIYVNGALYVEDLAPVADVAGANASQTILDTLLGDAQGTIKLIKDAENSYYTTIFVDYYQVAKVTSVEYKNNETTVSIVTKAPISDTIDTVADTDYDEIVISDEGVEEGKTAVSVTRNGAKAELASLVKGDIIAYAVNFEETDLEDPQIIKIIATNDTVSGKVTSVDPDDKTHTIDGKEYKSVSFNAADPALKSSYKLTLDPFGRIYETELDGTSTKYAIATKVTSTGALQMVLADGTTKTYEMSAKCASEIVTEVKDKTANAYTSFEDYLEAAPTAAERVIAYTIKNSSSEITSVDLVAGTLLDGKEYKSRTGKLGSATVSSTTQVIDATEIDGASTAKKPANYGTFSVDNFKDGTVYTGYAYSTGTYTSLIVLTNIGTTFGEEARFAVVQKAATPVTVDGDDVEKVLVLENGKANAELLFVEGKYDAAGLGVGDVFFYETDSDGYVDTVYIVYDYSAGDFTKLYDAVLADICAANECTGNDDPAHEDHEAAAAAKFPTGTDGWKYNLWDEGYSIQLVEGYVTNVTSNAITLAPVAAIANGALDTNNDIDDNHDNGVAVFAIDADCVAYEYDAFNENIITVAKRFSAKDASSVKASGFDRFEVDGQKGVYEGDLASKANYAVAMVVDGDVVAIYTIVK